MTTKKKLEVFFDKENEKLKLIEKYEENIIFFNDLLKKGHKEDIEFVIPIKIHKYAESLISEGYYTKAFTILEEVERDLQKIRGQSKWYKMYLELTIFLQGVCLGRLKKYKESNKYFKQLIKQKSINDKPANDRYIAWYKSNKKDQIDVIFNPIVYISLSIGLIGFILNIANISNFRVPVVIVVIVWTTILFAFLAPYVWKKIIDKQKIEIEC